MMWGIDIGMRCTGITAGDGSVKPAVGVWTYDECGSDLGALAEKFDFDLNRLVETHGAPLAIMYEAPLLLPSDKLLPLRKVYGMGLYLELWCKKRQVRCEEVSARRVKKTLTGNHLAPKKAVVAMVKRLGIPLPFGEHTDDAADSFAVWYVALIHHGDRAHLTRWDQALHSRRGFLV